MKEARLGILEDCLADIQEAYDTLQEVRDEEEEAYDNLPESMQDGERGDMMQEAIDNLDDAISSLDEVVDYMTEVTTNGADSNVMEIDPWQKLKIGDTVTHKSYGAGVIKVIAGDHFTIEFPAKSAIFVFPDAIDRGFITI